MYKIFKANDKDLHLGDEKASHNVIVVAYNKRSKNCWVKTITSLDKKIGDDKYAFKNKKLPSVRKGEIIVIPNDDMKSDVLTGIYTNPIKIKFSKLYKTDSKMIIPRRYKHLIKK